MAADNNDFKVFDFRTKDIIWTASDFDSQYAMNNFPYIHLIEYEQTHGAIMAQINQWIRLGQQIAEKLTGVIDKTDPYDLLYIAKPTNKQYILPYFMPYHHSINNQWEVTGLSEIASVGKAINMATLLSQVWSPAIVLTVPRTFKGTGDATYGIEFTLFNTVELGQKNDRSSVTTGMENNKKFIETIIKHNLFDFQENGIVIRPPSLYEIMIPGIRYCPVGVISSLTVNNVGSMNKYGNYIYPDAWTVTINIQELIKESGKIYSDATAGGTIGDGMNVRILNRGSEFTERANQIKNIVSLADKTQKTQDAVNNSGNAPLAPWNNNYVEKR